MNKNSKIYIAGHKGLVGSILFKQLSDKGFSNLVGKTYAELDLTRANEVESFFNQEKPEYVFLAAGKVGGIWANEHFSADFIYQNLALQTNIIHQCYRQGVKRLLFLGSSCIYPRNAPQPIKEEYLLEGPLEKTNEAYAIAKIAGIKMCQAYNKQYKTSYLCVMPTNLYGPNDNFDTQTAHVIPALIEKFISAKKLSLEALELWGSGQSYREFLYVEDFARACIQLMELEENKWKELTNPEKLPTINVGCGKEISIQDLAMLIANLVEFKGRIIWDMNMSDGTPKKLLDSSKISSLGWKALVGLKEGLLKTIHSRIKETL